MTKYGSDRLRCLTPVIDRALLVLDQLKGEIILKHFVMAAAATALIGISPIATAADTVVVIASHEVADFTAWKKGFDVGKDNRDKAGVTARYVLRDPEKPKPVQLGRKSSDLVEPLTV